MTTNKQLAKVFKDAMNYLYLATRDECGPCKKQTYICHAIDKTSHTSRDKEAAKKVIQKRLGRYRFYYSWVSPTYYEIELHTVKTWLKSIGIPESKLTVNRLQSYRHSWLKQLVEEFNGKYYDNK